MPGYLNPLPTNYRHNQDSENPEQPVQGTQPI